MLKHTTTRPWRRWALLTSALPVILVVTVGAGGTRGSVWRAPAEADVARAVQAGIVSVKDAAKLHLAGANGNTLVEEGKASGTLPGSARVTLNVGTTTATSSFKLQLSGGSITGYGTVRLHSGKSGQYDSFDGSVAISHGSGRYAHASGSGNLYGVIDRANDNPLCQCRVRRS